MQVKAYQDRSCFAITETLPLLEIHIVADGCQTKRPSFPGSPLISGFVNVGHARSNQKDRVYPIYLRDQKIYIPEVDLYDGGFVENDQKETSTRENSLNLHLCINKCVKCDGQLADNFIDDLKNWRRRVEDMIDAIKEIERQGPSNMTDDAGFADRERERIMAQNRKDAMTTQLDRELAGRERHERANYVWENSLKRENNVAIEPPNGHHSRRLSSNDIKRDDRDFYSDPRRSRHQVAQNNEGSSPYQPSMSSSSSQMNPSSNVINGVLDPRRQNREPNMSEFESPQPSGESSESKEILNCNDESLTDPRMGSYEDPRSHEYPTNQTRILESLIWSRKIGSPGSGDSGISNSSSLGSKRPATTQRGHNTIGDSENERVDHEEPADKRRRSDLVKNTIQSEYNPEVKAEPIDNGYDISKNHILISKIEKELKEKKDLLSKWEENGEKWKKVATEWYVSNNIESITENDKEGWKEKQNYLKHKNTLEKKAAKYKKTIADLEFQIEKLKK